MSVIPRKELNPADFFPALPWVVEYDGSMALRRKPWFFIRVLGAGGEEVVSWETGDSEQVEKLKARALLFIQAVEKFNASPVPSPLPPPAPKKPKEERKKVYAPGSVERRIHNILEDCLSGSPYLDTPSAGLKGPFVDFISPIIDRRLFEVAPPLSPWSKEGILLTVASGLLESSADGSALAGRLIHLLRVAELCRSTHCRECNSEIYNASCPVCVSGKEAFDAELPSLAEERRFRFRFLEDQFGDWQQPLVDKIKAVVEGLAKDQAGASPPPVAPLRGVVLAGGVGELKRRLGNGWATKNAKRLGIHYQTVCSTIRGDAKNKTVRAAVAEAIGLPENEIWKQ